MKTETKEIYKCDHCNKLYQIKRYAIAHENACKLNPKNKRPCFACNNLTKKVTIRYYDDYGGENSKAVTVLFCKAKNIFLYPPSVESKKNWFELGDESNSPMPKLCEDQGTEQTDDLNEFFQSISK